MDIQIENLQKKITLKINPLKNLITTILKNEGVTQASLNFVFVTAQKIRSINSKYLNHHYVTDVITFDYSDNKRKTVLDGEIFISTDAVRQNSRSYRTTEAKELCLYVVHGILHLLGYDDKSDADQKKMRKKEASVLAALGTKVNFVINPQT